MFRIFESNGGVEIGFTCKEDESGEAIEFKTYEEANLYGQINCAFDWQVIEF